MSSVKCTSCGLPNFVHEDACRRCGSSLIRQANKSKARRPRRFSFSSILIIAFVAGFAYYAYYGMQRSADEVWAGEQKRLAEQQKDKNAGLSRSEYEKSRSTAYGSSIQNSNSFSQTQSHNQDLQKAMDSATNTSSGK